MSKIVYPENEALRYVIEEQRKRIKELEAELRAYRDDSGSASLKDLLEGLSLIHI